MSFQAVAIQVEAPTTWHRATEVQVYTDWGDGTVDLTKPLLPRRHVLDRDQPDEGRYGEREYGSVSYGHVPPSVRGDGYGEYGYGSEPYSGSATRSVTVSVRVPDVYDTWKFAVEAVDLAGNTQSAPLVESSVVLSGRKPAALTAFALSTFAARIATFSFSGS